MSAVVNSPAELLMAEIGAWSAATGQSPGRLGQMVLNHGGFVPLLRKRGTLRPETAAALRQFMAAYPDKDALPEALARDLVREAMGRRGAWRPTGRSPAAERARAQALDAGARRRLARTAGGGISPVAHRRESGARDAVAMVARAALPEIGDAVALVRRQWPRLWDEVIAAARERDELPGAMLVRTIATGLAVVCGENG